MSLCLRIPGSRSSARCDARWRPSDAVASPWQPHTRLYPRRSPRAQRCFPKRTRTRMRCRGARRLCRDEALTSPARCERTLRVCSNCPGSPAPAYADVVASLSAVLWFSLFCNRRERIVAESRPPSATARPRCRRQRRKHRKRRRPGRAGPGPAGRAGANRGKPGARAGGAGRARTAGPKPTFAIAPPCLTTALGPQTAPPPTTAEFLAKNPYFASFFCFPRRLPMVKSASWILDRKQAVFPRLLPRFLSF